MIKEIEIKTFVDQVVCDGCDTIIVVDGLTPADHNRYIAVADHTFGGCHLCGSCMDIIKHHIQNQMISYVMSGDFKKLIIKTKLNDKASDVINKLRTGQL
ncbi:MAG: hypothetical protein CVT92_02630 [Bacteroidetes bacterium HGW-Bacteroidetes-1]|jgi:hypothetical protein|nr:MAG: hypothetical protein CVT92_02630 [Bacteroidetes bacterium HGW-Bacteroidetes-1]